MHAQCFLINMDEFTVRDDAQVATNIVAVKRLLGFGFERGASAQIDVNEAPDQTTHERAAATSITVVVTDLA